VTYEVGDYVPTVVAEVLPLDNIKPPASDVSPLIAAPSAPPVKTAQERDRLPVNEYMDTSKQSIAKHGEGAFAGLSYVARRQALYLLSDGLMARNLPEFCRMSNEIEISVGRAPLVKYP
jgi:hypothetical protein